MSKCAGHANKEAKSETSRANPEIARRQTSLGTHVCVQRDAAGLGVQPHAWALVREVLNSPGQPLDVDTRDFMEPRFGYDFSGVRVHTDQKAAESARAVNANAYTAGSHIAFGAERYAPAVSGGRKLMAHELTHVVQQAEGAVDGTSIGGGFSVSQPGDRFERMAEDSQRSFGRESQDVGDKPPSEVRGASQGNQAMHIQRDSLGLSTGQADTSPGANQAAALSAWSALGGALAGLGSMTAAIVGLKFARRQAEAAEDPPVAEPTAGGVTSNHVELPEVKGIDPGDLVDHPESTEEETEETVISGLKGDKPIPEEEKTSLSKELKTRKYTKKTATKKAEKADQEKSFTVLRLQQGAENNADFILTLRYNGTDVRGGATEDGEINGYLGGSAESNASVSFKASPGAPILDGASGGAGGSGDGKGEKGGEKAGGGTPKAGTATVRLLFGGTNVPPRKEPSGSLGLFFGQAKKKDYKVQRFSATAKFTGAGEFKGFDTLFASPRDRSVVQKGSTGAPNDPLVTIALAGSQVEAAKRLEPVNPSAPQVAPAPPPKKP